MPISVVDGFNITNNSPFDQKLFQDTTASLYNIPSYQRYLGMQVTLTGSLPYQVYILQGGLLDLNWTLLSENFLSQESSSFLRNQTYNSPTSSVIYENQSIFNPSNLTILPFSIFIIEQNADYYILGNLYNSGSIIVSGTLKIGGNLYNSGSIIGPGIIE